MAFRTGATHDCAEQIARFGFCTTCVARTGQAPTAQGALPLGEGEAPCAVCSEGCRPGAANTYQRQAGWARPRGATGGTHALALRLDLPQWAHAACIDDVKAGRRNQPPLGLGHDETF